jgi:hypothetical protein
LVFAERTKNVAAPRMSVLLAAPSFVFSAEATYDKVIDEK